MSSSLIIQDTNEKRIIKFSGLEYQEGSCLIIKDPRLNEKVVKKVINMINCGKNYIQIKKEIGNWFTRENLKTIKILIEVYNNEEFNYWHNKL